MLCLVFKLISQNIVKLHHILLNCSVCCWTPRSLVTCPQFLTIKPWAGLWFLEAASSQEGAGGSAGLSLSGALCSCSLDSLLPARPLCAVASCITNTSLYLEATPFVQLGLQPGAINVYAIARMKIPLRSAQLPDACVLWGFAYVLNSTFAFGHVYLGLKDQFDVSSGIGVFVPTSAVDKAHEVCEGGGWTLGVLLSALGAWQGLWLCLLTQVSAHLFFIDAHVNLPGKSQL